MADRASCLKTYFPSWSGREGSIYYVKEGQINRQAVEFVMTVPTDVDWLGFMWNAKPQVSGLLLSFISIGLHGPYTALDNTFNLSIFIILDRIFDSPFMG